MKKIPFTTRRQFLSTSAAALGFPMIVPRSVFGAAGRPAPSERITVGAIWQRGQTLLMLTVTDLPGLTVRRA
jgi:hypothetical protein